VPNRFWRSPPNESELRVDLINGSMIRLYGADNPDALRGPYLDGVVLDEFADMKPEVWYEVVRPMPADRQGWATFIGTPKGKNEFWRLYESAKKDPARFHMMLKASESHIIPETELADLRKEMSEDQYQQEFECSFEAAIKGAFYADEMRTMLAEGRICRIEINKDVKTHTAWDLGISDSTAIWFIQCVGRERRLVAREARVPHPVCPDRAPDPRTAATSRSAVRYRPAGAVSELDGGDKPRR
jgi:phage terminase large subunit